jgi:hypothetical protein
MEASLAKVKFIESDANRKKREIDLKCLLQKNEVDKDSRQ